MPLVLDIEYLLGVSFAAQEPASGQPDWPPQPDRVFSALVAAWAARGEVAEERKALEWLERQPAPLIEASGASPRAAASSFVPPNDRLQRSSSSYFRTRQPRRFPAALPESPVVRLVWPQVQEAPLRALDALARDVAYLGHSASLTRCAFSEEVLAEEWPRQQARRRVYEGRLRELESAFHAGRRPSAGEVQRSKGPAPIEIVKGFSDDWLVFEIVDGSLDLRAAAPACKALIKTLMSGYEQTAGPDAIPAWVSGHELDGSPTKIPHLAAVPLAFTGFEHADGSLKGFALVPPHGRDDLLSDAAFRKALAARLETVAPGDEEERRYRIRLWDKTFPSLELKIALSLETERASLDVRRYNSTSRLWATATPLVLDRHLKGTSASEIQSEMERSVSDACERSIGVRPARVVVNKHSAVRGTPSAYPSGNAPRWTGWRIPQSLTSRRLVHAVIDFGVNEDGEDRTISGPLLVGAGRFCGLGLCLPVNGRNR